SCGRCAAERSSPSRATSAAAARRSTRSSPPGTTSCGAPPKPRVQRGRRQRPACYWRRDELGLGVRLLSERHPPGGGELLLRHPPPPQGPAERALRHLCPRAPGGRHRGRLGAAEGEAPPPG